MADFLKVDEVLNNLDLKEDMVVAEFGCGSAVFALYLAKKLSKGRVYALDIQEEKLSALKGKASLEKVNNIFTVHCDLEATKGSNLQGGSLDIVLIPNVLFQSENKYAIMEEAKRVLKSGGQLLVIDWLKQGAGSPKHGLASPDEVKKMAGLLGFSLKKEFAVGDFHYSLIFIK